MPVGASAANLNLAIALAGVDEVVIQVVGQRGHGGRCRTDVVDHDLQTGGERTGRLRTQDVNTWGQLQNGRAQTIGIKLHTAQAGAAVAQGHRAARHARHPNRDALHFIAVVGACHLAVVAVFRQLNDRWAVAEIHGHQRSAQDIGRDGHSHRGVARCIGEHHRHRFAARTCSQQNIHQNQHRGIALRHFGIGDGVRDKLATPVQTQAAAHPQVVRQGHGHPHMAVIHHVRPVHTATELSCALQGQNRCLLASHACRCNGVHQNAAGG